MDVAQKNKDSVDLSVNSITDKLPKQFVYSILYLPTVGGLNIY
jgi:hypothetical protein